MICAWNKQCLLQMRWIRKIQRNFWLYPLVCFFHFRSSSCALTRLSWKVNYFFHRRASPLFFIIGQKTLTRADRHCRTHQKKLDRGTLSDGSKRSDGRPSAGCVRAFKEIMILCAQNLRADFKLVAPKIQILEPKLEQGPCYQYGCICWTINYKKCSIEMPKICLETVSSWHSFLWIRIKKKQILVAVWISQKSYWLLLESCLSLSDLSLCALGSGLINYRGVYSVLKCGSCPLVLSVKISQKLWSAL